MADFRKWFPVLAVVAVLLGSAVSANAQAFQCVANAGVPPLLRAEGLTELVGDMVLNCDGTAPAGGISANIRIFLNTNVTSRLVGAGNEALLLIDEPAPADQVFCPATTLCPNTPGSDPFKNVYQGIDTGIATVDWLGVPIIAPGSSGDTRIYRITNVRVNANQLGTSSSLIPTQVFMFISISGTTSVPVNNPQQIVGYVVPGMNFTVDGQSFRQCEEPGEGDYISLEVEEGFASAFKIRTLGGQPEPGVVYDTESGLTPTGADPEIGEADQGTRFIFRFKGAPSGIELEVPTEVASSTPGGQILCLVDGHDSDGAGGSPDCSGDDTITISGGVGTIVYEVVSSDEDFLDPVPVSISRSAIETYFIPVWVVYTSSLPGLTTTPATVSGTFAPLSTVTVADDTSSPIPRFADVAEDKDAFTINACRTLLLFPYVTNTAGFDTGIAISNTSMDPFGTDPQDGACSLNYYGVYPATGSPAPPPIATPVIEGGEQIAYTMSSGGGVIGTTKTCAECATPGFHGYMIAICDFQYAHAFAFVSDLGAAKLAEGYLALVIPDKLDLRSPDAFTEGSGANDGEQLVH